jgi:hypothetical protein
MRDLVGICQRPPRTMRADAVDPEPLVQSALCALWGPLPAILPARTPPEPDDPAKKQARRERLERQRDAQIRRSPLTGPGRVP